jgi:hypothetical protein
MHRRPSEIRPLTWRDCPEAVTILATVWGLAALLGALLGIGWLITNNII